MVVVAPFAIFEAWVPARYDLSATRRRDTLWVRAWGRRLGSSSHSMSDDKIVDFACYRALARGELASEDAAAWASEIEDRALRLCTKNARDFFTGLCVAVFDDVKNCRKV